MKEKARRKDVEQTVADKESIAAVDVGPQAGEPAGGEPRTQPGIKQKGLKTIARCRDADKALADQVRADQDGLVEFDARPPSVSEFSNRETRVPVILAVDVSASMSGRPAQQLAEALKVFKAEGEKDPTLATKIDLATVLFSRQAEVRPFRNFTVWQPPDICIGGGTAMGSALLVCKDLIKDRVQAYLSQGISFFPFLVVLLSDLRPTDHPSLMEQAAAWIQESEARRELHFYSFAVETVAAEGLASRLSKKRKVKSITTMDFQSLFRWLLSSMDEVSQTSPDEDQDPPEYPGAAAEAGPDEGLEPMENDGDDNDDTRKDPHR